MKAEPGATMRAKCFISYARKEKERLEPLVNLIRASGSRTFRDVDNLEFGSDWELQLTDAIGDARLVLVFWSEVASTAKGVLDEVEHALGLPGCRVVPVILDDTPMLPDLKKRHGVDLRPFLQSGVLQHDAALQETARTLRAIMDGVFPRVETELMEARRYLRAFNAIANSNVKVWFGGSRDLCRMAYDSVFRGALMTIWRLTDPDDPNSVPGILRSAGKEREAQQVIDDLNVRFVRHYVENRLLRNAEYLLDQESEYLPGRKAKDMPFIALSEVLDLCSRLYMKHRGQDLAYLDPIRQYNDPFEDSFKDGGLPGVDFPPADIFKP